MHAFPHKMRLDQKNNCRDTFFRVNVNVNGQGQPGVLCAAGTFAATLTAYSEQTGPPL